MFRVTYKCKCGSEFTMFADAQKHANATRHEVNVSGVVTPEEKITVRNALDADEKVKLRHREKEIMRLARDKGLVPDGSVKP